MADKIQSFKDLLTWQEAQDLAVTVYAVTRCFPDEEKFGLTNQLRRAAVSVGSNIAEGFSRQSYKEKLQFYHIAKGSLTEVESQIDLAYRIKYLSHEDFTLLDNKLHIIGKLLTALTRNIPTH